MKSRSHRLPLSDSPDDWGDGSWTVDCSCGVTFDDGEEMVSCDVCGVWVHTRCSRFVRSAASFACHNCKAANLNPNPRPKPNPNSYASLAEETEVAQLLVELPTKAPDPPSAPLPGPGPGPGPHPTNSYRPPIRLWAEVPVESRVHVQGIPGGDPALFEGISSSVFTADLWRCTGYVPKKFNFQYREFSCWDEDDAENPASQGADVLYLLSNSAAAPRVVERHQVERRVQLQGWGKKDRNRLRSAGSHSSKRRREEESLGKKRVRGDAVRAAADLKRRSSFPVADTSRAGLGAESDVAEVNDEERKVERILDNDSVAEEEGVESGSKPKDVLVGKSSKVGLANEASKQKGMLETPAVVKKDDGSTLDDSNVLAKESVQEEDGSKSLQGLRLPKDENHYERDLNESSCHGVIDKEEPRAAIASPSVPDKRDLEDSNGAIPLSINLQKVEVKIELADGRAVESAKSLSSPVADGNLRCANQVPHCCQKSSGHSSEILEDHELAVSLPSDEHKPKEAEKEEILAQQLYDKISEEMETGVSEPKQHGQVVEESRGSSAVQEGGHSSMAVNEPKKCEDSKDEDRPSLHKPLIGAAKAPSTSFTPVTSKSSVSSTSKSLVSTSSSSTAGRHLTKQQVKVTSLTSGKIDNAANISSAAGSMREGSRRPVKGHSKGSDYHGSKSSQSSRIPHFSACKPATSDSKERPFGSSSKSSTAMNVATEHVPVEAIGLSETQNASIQIKQVPSGQKSEKVSQPIPQMPSKLLSHSSSLHLPACVNAATALSDEELALLLHQELNSSPRVPRVPRMRQATGAQLASPPAPSMLSKRSSYSGGKDQVFRRKNKEEASRDSSRNPHEFVNEIKRVGRASSSPDHRYQEAVCMTDGSAKKDSRNRSPDTVVSLTKNVSGSASNECESSCLPSFEATAQTALSIRNLPRNVPDDVASVTCTLPVLLDEIISKGKCSTYQELCDAVQPHWTNLRKPNGDRYAYSSHSHAVLDCLRNRSEWAHLIDRGPKTNSSKRRRKVDAEMPAGEESEYEGKRKGSSKDLADKNEDSHREDFPKRKRNVRKRRRLELQGEDTEDAQKRKHNSRQSSDDCDNGDDDDDDPAAVMSHSSNDGGEGLSSEVESHGGEDLMAGAEMSTSAGSGDTGGT